MNANRSGRRQRFFVLLVAVVCTSVPCRARCDELATILKAWEERQRLSAAVVVAWEEHHDAPDIDWLSANSGDLALKELAEREGAEAVFAKIPRVKYQQHKTIKLTDLYYRYAFKGHRTIDGVLQPQELDIAMDGEKVVNFSAAYKVGRPPGANVYKAEKSLAPNTSYLPIVFCTRPFDVRVGGLKASEFTVVDRREVIEGVEFVKLQWREAKSKDYVLLWLDPLHGYLPRRASTFRDEKLIHQVDIEFEADLAATHPLGWRSVTHKLAIGSSSVVAKVVKWDVLKSLPRSEFEIEFPVGTAVSDFRGDVERNYVIEK